MLTFITTLFLQHFNVVLSIHLETDASGYTISDILSQKHLNGWRVTAYFLQKMILMEQKYKTYNEELLAIVESFCHWQHYLKGFTHSVEVLLDHSSLQSFIMIYKLL